jgi:pyruvate,water dikinase
MVSHLAAAGVSVPGGFATTADAYREFLAEGGLRERIAAAIAEVDVEDVAALTHAGTQIRAWVEEPFPPISSRRSAPRTSG